jgi:hypothetical protein
MTPPKTNRLITKRQTLKSVNPTLDERLRRPWSDAKFRRHIGHEAHDDHAA